MTTATDPADATQSSILSSDSLPFWGGIVSVILAWFIVALAGLIAIYCGYLLYYRQERHIAGLLIAGFGSVAIAFWIIAIVLV